MQPLAPCAPGSSSAPVSRRLPAQNHPVSRAKHRHSRDCAHKSYVLVALMCSAVLADRKTGMGRGYFNVHVGISDRIADLLIGTSGSEHGKGAGKNQLSGRRKTGCNAYKILFGYSAIEKALGVKLFKYPRFCSARKVGVKHYKIVYFAAELGQCLAVSFTGCLFYNCF